VIRIGTIVKFNFCQGSRKQWLECSVGGIGAADLNEAEIFENFASRSNENNFLKF
jgi:hypothetical protein